VRRHCVFTSSAVGLVPDGRPGGHVERQESMGRQATVRETTPEFIRYANWRQTFAVSTPWRHQKAWRLVATYCRPMRWRHGYTPKRVWQVLRAHQPTFRAVLEGLIAQAPTPEQLATIRLHVGHFGPHPHWDHSPALSSLDPTQPLDIEAYGEVFAPQDPLDPLYYQLHRFLRKRPVQDLHRCPICGRFFLARTARAQTYCRDRCRMRAHPRSAEANRERVRKHRAGEREKDRAAVHAAVQRVREAGAHEVAFAEAWATFQEMGRRSIRPRTFQRLLREELGADFRG
jgi:hypothetical protein